MIGLKDSENGGRGIAFFELFEEIMILQVLLGLFLVGLQSGIKDAFDVGKGSGCGSPRNRNRGGRLAHIEGMRAGRRNAGDGIRGASLLSIRRFRL